MYKSECELLCMFLIDIERLLVYYISINNHKQSQTIKYAQRNKGMIYMLLEERLDQICQIANERGSVTTRELVDILDVSEATIRRDVTTLAEQNRIIRAHGGIMALNATNTSLEDMEVSTRRTENRDEKIKIGKAAASLITNNDFVYLDAGTSTEYMIDHINAYGAVFVTNALTNAVQLAKRGFTVYIIGGQVKSITEAIIDAEAAESLAKYNFTKGFFGTNGVSEKQGFTTPDIREASIKSFAMSRCTECYVLCDNSKFNKVSKVTFGNENAATIITDKKLKGFEKFNIMEVE